MTSINFPYGALFLLFISCSYARCQEFIRETHCWNEDFRLDCEYNSVLAFHEAYFTNDEAEVNRSTCPDAKDGKLPCTEDLRESINRRCSGMSHCHYDLLTDLPERECRCQGIIVLLYSCVPESKLERYCNLKLTGSSGYISSPGYPRFYPKVSNCSWFLESSIRQEMKLTILDLDMRSGVRTKGNEICHDSLTVLENSHKLRQVCGHSSNSIPITTTGGRVDILFKSYEFLPSRGFLLHYKFNGCQKLPPPRLGYMVYSNNRSALYMCCKGHVFNDTLSNSLLLQCVDGTYWNGTIMPCLPIQTALRQRSNYSEDYEDIYRLNNPDVVEVYLSKHKYIEEVLIPAASVVGLVFGNVAIILLIQKIRKKRKSNVTNHNGQTIPRHSMSASSSEVPQTLHVPVTVPIDSTIPQPIPVPHPVPVIRQAPRVLMTDL